MTGKIIFMDSGDDNCDNLLRIRFYQGNEITLRPSITVGGIMCYNGVPLQSILAYKEELVA